MKSQTDLQLLADAFMLNGKVAWSATDTDQGTQRLWNILERKGWVVKATKTGRGVLGHHFSYRITQAGRYAVETPSNLISPRAEVVRKQGGHQE